ncbi:MAG: SH3 domain-containing protein [Spirochaetales bacterium]|nr:SH3 domain-containing protein [Spirochaetales bacterium]
MSKRILYAATALLLLISLTSCNRKIGTGVVLWSPDESVLKNGAVVNIYEESKIRRTYAVALPGEKDTVEIDTWRIDFFEGQKEAEDFAESYAPYTNTYTYTDLSVGLPVRDEPVVKTNNRVYKLRQGQEIKVIGRSDEVVPVGNLNDYWYHVLTDDGVTGYAYGTTLVVYSMNDTGMVIENASDTTDELLETFLNSVWRPSYYNDMITKNVIDLTRFKDSFALRIDPEKKVITLRLQDRNITEQYTDITKFGAKRYDFEGTSFRVILVSDSVASIFYKHDGKDVNESFVRLSENVNEIVSTELDRRKALLTELMEKGERFTSANYGSISIIDETGRFIWNNIQELINRNIISAQSEPQGRIEFSRFPDSLIKNTYKGVITFLFRNGSEVNFLYSYTEKGVSFIYVPDRYIKNRIVTTDQFFDPALLYFEFEKPAVEEES